MIAAGDGKFTVEKERFALNGKERHVMSLALMTLIQRTSVLPPTRERSGELRVMRSLLERLSR